MYRIIRYFFYRLYRLDIANGQTDAILPTVCITLFLSFNLLIIYVLVCIITSPESALYLNKVFMVIAYLLVLYSTYLILVKDNRNKKILVEFNEIKGSKLYLNLGLFLYIVATIISTGYVINLARSMPH
jgi:amino acid permease